MTGKREKSPVSKTSSQSDFTDDERLKKLAESLREKYADIRDEPVPQNLQDLIEELRAAEKKSQNRH